MRRFLPFRLPLNITFCLLGALHGGLFAYGQGPAAEVPADHLFPGATKGFVSVASVDELTVQWKKTQIGKLMNDDIMKPFIEDVRRQIGERFTDQFGITLEGIEELPSGELAFGLVVLPEQTPGFALTMNITGQEEKARGYLDRLGKQLVEAGAKSVKGTVDGEEAVFLEFPPKNEGEPVRKIFYAISGHYLIGSNQLSLLELFVDRLKSDHRDDCLADVPGYKTVFARLREDLPKAEATTVQTADAAKKVADEAKPEGVEVPEEKSEEVEPGEEPVAEAKVEETNSADGGKDEEKPAETADEADASDTDTSGNNEPLIRWYVEPLAYGKAVSLLVPRPEKRKNKPLVFDVLAEQGFDAIRGVGGVVSVKAEEMDLVHRTFVYAPKPYRLAMQMLSFPNSDRFGPPRWMPRDLAGCLSLYVEPLAIFDNMGSLIDSLIMEEKGVWQDVIHSLEVDETGPQINIRKDLVEHLGQRIMVMSKYVQPITVNSESIVVAVELKDGTPEKVAESLERLFGGDPAIQKSLYKDYVIWQNRPPEDLIEPTDFEADVPPLGGFGGAAPVAPQPTVPEQPKEKRDPVFPNGGVTVANECVFIGTNVEYLQEILDRFEAASDSIGDAADYKVVDLVFADMGVTREPHFFQLFGRTDETVRPTYELIREGKMPESQTLLGKIINMLSTKPDTPKGAVRKQAIDGSKMPEFEAIRSYFGPTGLYGVAEESGWFIKGFVLEK